MKRTALIAALVSLCLPGIARSADRLTDKDVKSLVERIDDGRDRFEGALDDKLKNGILRGASGEVNVKNFLNDFQESIDRLKERLKPEYAASAEVGTVLRQATQISNFFRQQPAGTRGESEWNRLSSDLKALATAYGADFPLAENATVRRIGDRELAASADEVAKAADRVKQTLDNELKKDKTIDKAQRESIVGEADQLAKDAKVLRDRVKDGDPSSAEAERLLAQAAKVQSLVGNYKAPMAAGALGGVRARLLSIASAFGASMPGGTD
jgi:hypothetical protein